MEPTRVDIPGVGPVDFPESMSAAEVNAAAKRLHDEANKPPDQGFFSGLRNSLPSPSGIVESITSLPQTIPRVLREFGEAQKNPIAHGQSRLANFPNTPLGKVFNGRPMEGLGEVAGIAGQAAIGEAVPRVVRGRLSRIDPQVDRYMPNTPGTIDAGIPPDGPPTGPPPHLDLSTPVKAGSLTPDQMVERINAAKAQGYTPPPTPPKPMIQPRTAPTEAPMPPVQVDVASLPDSWKQFAEPAAPAQPRPIQMPTTPAEHGPATAPSPVVGKLRRFSSDLKGQPGLRGTIEDVSSGVQAGSDEAAGMSRMHRYDAETVNRYQHMMENENGTVSVGMLRALGLPVELAAAGYAAKQVGLPGWLGAAGAGAYRVGKAYPLQSAEALRAALLAAQTTRQQP